LVPAKRAYQGEQNRAIGVARLKTKIDGVTSPPKRQNCTFAHVCIGKGKPAKMAENAKKKTLENENLSLYFCEKIRLHLFSVQSEQN
jgi:hypothetical protein